MSDKIIIKKGLAKGDDGHRTFSIRIKDELVDRLDKLAQETNRSRNDIVVTFIEHGLDNFEVVE